MRKPEKKTQTVPDECVDKSRVFINRLAEDLCAKYGRSFLCMPLCLLLRNR